MNESVLKDAIACFGEASQQEMAVEECAEFILAMQKVKRVGGRKIKPDAIPNLISEIADVTIMMRQMALIFGEDAVNAQIEFKINRLKERLGFAAKS